MRVILRVFGYMRGFWLIEVVAYLCMLAINGVRLAKPQLIRSIVDIGIGDQQQQVLVGSVLLLFAATFIQGVFRFGERYLTEKVSQGIAYTMRSEVYRKLQSLSFSYHDRAETGQLLARATNDVGRLRRLTGRGILMLVDALVLLTGTTIVLVRMNPLLAGLSLLLALA